MKKILFLPLFFVLVAKCYGDTIQQPIIFLRTEEQVIYGERFYAVCQLSLELYSGTKANYVRPLIRLYADYNPSPGLNLATNPSCLYLKSKSGAKEIPINGKEDFELLAVDKLSRGYNAYVGKCIGRLGETGKYFAIKAKIHYDGSKPKEKQLKAKYKIKLLRPKDFPDSRYRYKDF